MTTVDRPPTLLDSRARALLEQAVSEGPEDPSDACGSFTWGVLADWLSDTGQERALEALTWLRAHGRKPAHPTHAKWIWFLPMALEESDCLPRQGNRLRSSAQQWFDFTSEAAAWQWALENWGIWEDWHE